MSLLNVPVTGDEILSRFILFSKWIRPSDKTIKPEAFIPHPWLELSVTRQKNLTEYEIWHLGRYVSSIRSCTLYGRADISADVVISNGLTVEPSEPPLNHANIKDYPADKSEQKLKALIIASEACFRTEN